MGLTSKPRSLAVHSLSSRQLAGGFPLIRTGSDSVSLCSRSALLRTAQHFSAPLRATPHRSADLVHCSVLDLITLVLSSVLSVTVLCLYFITTVFVLYLCYITAVLVLYLYRITTLFVLYLYFITTVFVLCLYSTVFYHYCITSESVLSYSLCSGVCSLSHL